MTYYDELGIAVNASTEEIRQAYKVLARPLHPDIQADERLRRAAECQMRRVNEILDTLTDPVKRRAYNQTLAGRPVVVEGPRWTVTKDMPPAMEQWIGTKLLCRYWFLILTGVLLAGSGIWYAASPDRPAVAGRVDLGEARAIPAAANAGFPQAAPKMDAARSAAPVPSRRFTQPSVDAPEPVETGRAAEPDEVTPTAGTDPDAPAQAERAARLDVPPPPLPAIPETSFAGEWLYAFEAAPKLEESRYPAIYVELVLIEEGEDLTGSYYARYRIPDRAMSPEVRFRLQGKVPAGRTACLQWSSEDGTRGDAELVLQPNGVLTLNWWTTGFGRRKGLASGTARLLRQRPL